MTGADVEGHPIAEGDWCELVADLGDPEDSPVGTIAQVAVVAIPKEGGVYFGNDGFVPPWMLRKVDR